MNKSSRIAFELNNNLQNSCELENKKRTIYFTYKQYLLLSQLVDIENILSLKHGFLYENCEICDQIYIVASNFSFSLIYFSYF